MLSPRTYASKIRLYSGLALLFFVVTHFINHSMGLFGLDALNSSREFFVAFWRSPPLWPVLPMALLTHIGLALGSVLKRRTLKMSALEYLRLALGLLGPTVLVGHLTQTRMMNWYYGVEDTYAWVIAVAYPVQLWMLSLAAVVIWVHGILGVYFLLRLKSWFHRWRWILFVPTLLLPTLALCGAWVAARELGGQQSRAEWQRLLFEQTALTPVDYQRISLQLYLGILTAVMTTVALAFGVRWVWHQLQKTRTKQVQIRYVTGQKVSVSGGTSILEASRLNAIPHPSICGGRGRCSTCRVRVVIGEGQLDEPSRAERQVLERINAPPRVRLACQVRPKGDIVVARLLHNENEADAFAQTAATAGHEQEVAIMFADLRGFTQLSENRMAYDVVFLLNEYFARMGHDIEAAGGFVDKFIGDGVMAIFGMDVDIETACRQALDACARMSKSIEVLNERLVTEVQGKQLKLGIGVHGGQAIVGEMGYKATRHMTAIGDVVNTASRLEGLCKDYDAEVVLSDFVAQRGGTSFEAMQPHDANIRGKSAAMKVWAINSCAELKSPTIAK